MIIREERIDEGFLKGSISSITIKQNEKILEQMKYSICKIDGKTAGTGFFCYINYENIDIPCLITNYHVLDDNYIKQNKTIHISMKDNSINENLSIDINDIIFLSTNDEYDVIIIKLKNKEKYINYLELDDSLFNKNSEQGYKNESIYILHYSNSANSSVSYGYGINCTDNDIEHKCNTQLGSSGGPILNLSTNKVIGIHKAYTRLNGKVKYNLGTLLKYPLNKMKKGKNNKKSNEIIIEIEVGKKDLNKKISILRPNKEINETNTELYINNKKIEFNKYFIPKKEGIYSIKLKFNLYIKDCFGMFAFCSNIKKINLSNFETKNVTNMGYMFYNCSNLKNIDLSPFDTKNVTCMNNMFSNCTNLESIDLSSFKTKNVTNMDAMFFDCHNLETINVSSFNTDNVNNMTSMFEGCSKLNKIDISSFNIKNETIIERILGCCNNLKELKIKKELFERKKKELEDLSNTKIVYT